MPKAPPPGTGLSCLFAINKPTGIPSMVLLNKLQPLFSSSPLFTKIEEPKHPNDKSKKGRRQRQERVKMGQGGTLDPLADGVLVVGTNAGTKALTGFLDCTKEYRAIGLFGCATDSYDSEGKRAKESGWEGVTRESIEAVLGQFTGNISQVPPIFSALKMDGKPLYDYARNNLPLPRPIAARNVNVSALSLLSFTEGDAHSYEFPKESLDDAAKIELERIEKMVKEGGTVVPETVDPVEAEVKPVIIDPSHRPPIFEISMTVSSGTYVRSIVHDIATALGTTAHVVKLTRTRQGEFTLNSPADTTVPYDSPAAASSETADASVVDPTASKETVAAPVAPEEEEFEGGCVEWTMLEEAIEDLKKAGGYEKGTKPVVRESEELHLWEKVLLRKCKLA